MTHRVNIMIDDSLWAGFQAIPPGERSGVLNRALAEYLLRQQREAAAQQMAALRIEMPRATYAEDLLREERSSH
ncbi:hypothetical protein [Uliginosibacterium sp. 31-12]|uniref:hypothetical protein n=1 Tax=Uliginosibacterium sp. 31-12 TaxID=3062781 RepID=UPI0026E18A3B|nr:hypothetical protein [Uliginosibacterium sp. 31-12]MDO6386620.1 hypothetical protein [Uliginosibacterium sp. 31-12]